VRRRRIHGAAETARLLPSATSKVIRCRVQHHAFAREKYDHFALRALLKSLGFMRSATELIRRHIDREADGRRVGRLAQFTTTFGRPTPSRDAGRVAQGSLTFILHLVT